MSDDLGTRTVLTLTDRERTMLAHSLLLNVSIQEALGQDPIAVERCIRLHERLVEGLEDE